MSMEWFRDKIATDPASLADLREAGVTIVQDGASWKYIIPVGSHDRHTGYYPTLVEAVAAARGMLEMVRRHPAADPAMEAGPAPYEQLSLFTEEA